MVHLCLYDCVCECVFVSAAGAEVVQLRVLAGM